MCGITGFTGKRNNILLNKMLKVIAHRGKDERIIWAEKNFNLGMNRLAINDLRHGIYPMRYRGLRLVYNGEIYNSKQLRRLLSEQGIRLKSDCDGEVILPLYHRFGVKAFGMLDGMFALAIVDLKKNQIILARDKFGEKPLFYSAVEGELMFASEIRSLLVSNKIDRAISAKGLAEYLQQGYVFAPETLLNSVKKLKAGSYLIYGGKKLITKSYFKLKNTQPLIEDIGEKDLVNILENKIRSAVKSRLLSDVPIGCFLSGGVDSSLVTYFAKQELKELHTFSVSFSESEHDESKYSRIIAKLLGTQHHEIDCSAESVKALIGNWGKIIDEPVCDAAMIPTYLLSREASKFVKVILAGEGADEIFGGYSRYWKYLLLAKFKKAFKPISETYSTQGIWFGDDLKNLTKPFKKKVKSINFNRLLNTNNLLLEMQLTDIEGYLPDQLFRKVDMMSMRHTLEARAPFVDPDLALWALTLPQKYKVQLNTGKFLFKKLAEKFFPHGLVWRKKHGFTLPLNDWFRGPLIKYATDSVTKLSKLSSGLDWRFYGQLVDKHIRGEGDCGDRIFNIIALTTWAQKNKIKI